MNQSAVIEDLQYRIQQEDREGDGIKQSGWANLADSKDKISTAKVSTSYVSSATCANHLEVLCTNTRLILKIKSLQLLVDNIKRENKMIASMYHILAERLQMDNVVLQRRAEAPQSWMNRQRKLVDPTIYR